jgi:hypothetical protein
MTSYGFSINTPEEPVYNTIDVVRADGLQLSTIDGFSFAGGDAGIPTLPGQAFTNVLTTNTATDLIRLVTVYIPSVGLIRIEPATTSVTSSATVTNVPPTSTVSSSMTLLLKDGDSAVALRGQATLDTDGIVQIVCETPGGWDPEGDYAYIMPSFSFTYTVVIPK